MSYRDDLGQAHQRIAQLEGELREAKGAKDEDPGAHRTARRTTLVALVVVALLAGLGVVTAVALVKTRAAPVVVTSADRLVSHPDAYVGKRLRVQGELVVGTLVKLGADDSCELRFTMERDHLRLPVHLQGCLAPIAFHDAAGVMLVVEGELQRDGTFVATALLNAQQDFPGMQE